MANKEAKFTKEETSQPTNEVATQLEEAAAFLVDIKLRKHMQRDNVITHMPFLPEEHVKDLLGPELKKSRFVEFQEQFSEDMFFKKPKIGKVSSLKAKPDTFTNENFTYGIVHLKSESVYGLIMPQKSVDEIQQGYTNLTAKRVCRQ